MTEDLNRSQCLLADTMRGSSSLKGNIRTLKGKKLATGVEKVLGKEEADAVVENV